ncbi:helix-turn-helix domain-containing protein [Ligilactobacillus sp. Marseille-Q7487]|uniref:winged helix-turn-helix transcriptional regulator n=1 Tax=Ligilactobacillus sp. Marseille-Q7487 TaxID=3022128 RepID=UPI0024A9D093|nr:helix-turn-helix domain-containing protein [Ligilactobacillus sp. Marseille-Q7487]
MIEQKNTFKMCPKFEKTFGILGKKWNGLIIEVLLTEGPQRFKDLAQKIDKCSDRVLTERLKELENEELVQKVASDQGCRMCYCLTPRGEDLKQIMDAVHAWAEKWYSCS